VRARLASARPRVYEHRMRNDPPPRSVLRRAAPRERLSRPVLAVAVAVAAAALALAACGPSGKQVTTAKQARYQGDRQQIFAVIKQTVQSKYGILKADDAALGLQTEGRWYTAEGQPISTSMGDTREIPDQSLNISFVVELLSEGDRLIVSVKPIFSRHVKGKKEPDILDAKDPSVPEWAHGKGDNLQVTLHEALKQYEAGGAAPAPGPAAPAPAPAAPAPSPDPVTGSTPPPPAP